MPSELLPSSGKHHQQPPCKKWQGLQVAKGTVIKKEKKQQQQKAAEHFEKTHLVLSHDIKKEHSIFIYVALNSPRLWTQRSVWVGRRIWHRWGENCSKRRSACSAVGFEAMAVSAKQASVEIPMVPAPTSTSRCDIKACREKHDTEKQQDRGYYGMTPPLPIYVNACNINRKIWSCCVM